MAENAEDQLLETARRHVDEATNRVARQIVLASRLKHLGHVQLAEQADRILGTLKTSLRLAREDLEERQKAAARKGGSTPPQTASSP